MSYLMSRIAGALIVAWLIGYALGNVFRVFREIHKAILSTGSSRESE